MTPELRRWPICRKRSVAGIVALGLATSGCYPKAGPAPDALSPENVAVAAKRWPDASAQKLSDGHDLFVRHCNACHSYPDLTSVEDNKWPKIIDSMGNNAHIGPPEKDAILRFVLAWRSTHTGP